MARYACFTSKSGETWWELSSTSDVIGRMVARTSDDGVYPYDDRVMHIRSVEQNRKVPEAPRSDHDDLPDWVLARIAFVALTKGSE